MALTFYELTLTVKITVIFSTIFVLNFNKTNESYAIYVMFDGDRIINVTTSSDKNIYH